MNQTIIEFLNSKMRNTKGESPEVATYNEGYNKRIKEEWELSKKLKISTDMKTKNY